MTLVALAAMAALLLLLPYAGYGADVHARAAVAIGFLLLGGDVAGELVARLRLPRLTGYLLLGVVVGPQLVGFVGKPELEALRLVVDLKLGLIAFTAGGELKLRMLRERGRSILWHSVFQTLLPLVAVLAFVAAAGRGLLPFLEGAPWGTVVAAGLLLGVVAASRSATVTVVVLVETRARGPVADTGLGVVILQDLLLLLVFPAVLAAAGALAAPGGGGGSAVIEASREVAVGLGSGAVLGGLIALYLRYVNREMVLFTIGLALFLIEAASWLGLHSPTLICLTAGFVASNFSARGHEFNRAVEHASLPVYVVFFSVAGAKMDLGALVALWPATLALFAARLGANVIASRTAARIAGDPPEVGRYVWMGLVSQAGLSFGLAVMVEQALPAWAPHFQTLALASILLNELLGPVAWRYALGKAGEIRRGP